MPIRVARTLWRHRSNLVGEASSAIQRMQKALTEMNVQLHNVLSDISGVSGMAMIQAILKGERDPWALAALACPGVKASQADIAKSLHGNWRKELLVVLRHEVGTLPDVSGQDRRMRPGVADPPTVAGVQDRHSGPAPSPDFSYRREKLKN